MTFDLARRAGDGHSLQTGTAKWPTLDARQTDQDIDDGVDRDGGL